MAGKYAIIKQLIDLLEVYEQETNELNLLEFTEWVSLRVKEKPALNVNSSLSKLKSQISEQYSYVTSLDDKAKFLECISRVARYQEFYTRKFFVDLSINSRLEYLFLHTIRLWGKVKKTDLITIHLLEYSTGMDTIRRLLNNGLILEMPDETDKRAKLLMLSKKGEDVLEIADKKISDERNMFFACISANKWKKALPVLEEINAFHNSIYIQHNDKPFAELQNLMDSLKHLYK